jgi:flagellar M-ring protein FliF
MQQQLTSLRGAWSGIPARARYAIIAVAVATLVVLFLVLRASTSTEWKAVASDLPPEKIGEAQTALEEAGIESQVSENGLAIEVPVEDLPKAASALIPAGIAAKGTRTDCEASGDTGGMVAKTSAEFDLMTETCHENQAANAIEGVDGIESAEVDVALPGEALFAEDAQEATAAVTLRTDGTGLSRDAIQGIQKTVAQRFSGLEPVNVVVTDQTGEVLGGSDDSGEAASMQKLSAEATMNEKIERDLMETFESIVGPGNVVITSNVELDMDKINREVIENAAAGEDGEPLVEVEDYAKELLNGSGEVGVQGVAGTGTNQIDPDDRTVTPDIDADGSRQSDYLSDEARVTYANNKVAEAIQVAEGAVIRFRIGAVVDDDVDPTAANAVKNAVQAWMGGNAQDSFSFDVAPLAAAQDVEAPDAGARTAAWATYLKWALLGIGLIGLAFVLRRTLTQRTAELLAPADDLLLLDSGDFTPIPIAELEAALAANQPDAERRERIEMQKKVEQIADSKPNDVANELRRWMHHDDPGFAPVRKAG